MLRALTRINLAMGLVVGLAQPAMAQSELAGTSWRLLEIASMNDTVQTPEATATYDLTFLEEGRAAITADCNRGSGTWNSASPGQLEFGPIAATRAMCPPGSFSDSYLAQFEWARTYVIEDDHLFLATMADGSILEFAPAIQAPAASVLGEPVYATDPMEIQEVILTKLFDNYAIEQGLAPTEKEVDALVAVLQVDDTAEGLSTEEQAEVAEMRRAMGFAMVRQWKVNRALYDHYGGRIIYQQLGPEPLDAYRAFLEEQSTAGQFKILDPAAEEQFWQYFTDESRHEFMVPGGADAKAAFSVPPWER